MGIAENKFTVPEKCGKPAVHNVTAKTCSLVWSRPEYDGGSDITGYWIEKKDYRSTHWFKCHRRICRDMRFQVKNLIPGKQYEFRITAENAAGFSEPSNLSEIITAADPVNPPGPVMHPKVRDTSANTLTINWTAPAYDSGHEITGYVVEALEECTDEWVVVATTPKVFAKFEVKRDTAYMIRVASENAGGLSKFVQVPGIVRPMEKLEKPEYDLDANLRKVVIIKAGNSVSFQIPIKGRPVPNCKWTYNEADVGSIDRCVVESSEEEGNSFTKLTIDDVCRDDTGKWHLYMENAAGKAATFINLKVLDTPGKVTNIQVRRITKTSAHLTWDLPKNEGGTEVVSYNLEKRESTHRAFTTVLSDCLDPNYTFKNLHTGASYYFRISANNAEGVGLHNDTDLVTITETPGGVRNLQITDTTDNSISCKWEGPEDDGGTPIANYHISYAEIVAGAETYYDFDVRQPECCIKDLEKGKPYEIIVWARNEAGLGFREKIGPIVCQELLIVPDIDMSSIIGRQVNCRVGAEIRLDLPIVGKPKPMMTWTKDRIPCKREHGVAIERSPSGVTIAWQEVTKEHAGQYYCKLESKAGTSESSFILNVFGVPGKVRGPIEAIDIDATEIHLDWEIPDDTGGSDITGYVIEKKLATMDKFNLVTASCTRSQFRVKKLEEKCEYVFRICAENKYGLGPWLESPPFTCRSKYRKPTAPSSPQFYEVTANTMTMIWNAPQSTGGTELLGYYLE